MKFAKVLIIVFLLFGGLVLVSCGGASSTSDSSFSSPVEAAQAPTLTDPTATPDLTETQPITPTLSETITPDPAATLTPILTLTTTLTITPTATTPPPLPLRDDLPPLTLRDWPRPDQDNGLGIHYLASGYHNAAELDKEIARMKSLHMKWALVIYADENQLKLAAQKFKDAGIMVVWRKTLRPFQRYSSWGRDIEILNQIGMPPYMQLYNEPELPAEWEDHPIDQEKFFSNLLQATKDVYNAGGYPGVQFLDEDTLRRFIDEIYARNGEAIFHRMFFVPHAAGLNHPPDYVEDSNGVLGFRVFASIFFKRLGFVPPFIVGEGGWKIDGAEDNRFPPIDDQLHRDYTLAVFNWFSSGKLSNGAPLPDYLFTFCHWMLAGKDEAGAWFDSFTGDRTLTIQAVQQLPQFTRKFSWDK